MMTKAEKFDLIEALHFFVDKDLDKKEVIDRCEKLGFKRPTVAKYYKALFGND
jgi:hypothetical protein